MERFNVATVARLTGEIFRTLEGKGLAIRVLTPGPESEALYAAIDNGRRVPQLAFRPTARAYCPNVAGAFWVVGSDKNGVGIVQACCALDLGRSTLADHLKAYGGLYCVDGIEVRDPAPEVRASALYAVRGQACYFGETWFRPGSADEGGYRGQGLSELVLRLTMGLAWLEFRPSTMFGFAEAAIAKRGVTLQYGFFENYPHGATWEKQDGGVDDVWLAMTTGRSFPDLFAGFSVDRGWPNHL